MKFKELEFFTAITNIIKKYHNGRDIILIGYYPRFADFLTENGLTIRKTYRLSEGKKNVSPLRFIKNDKLKAEEPWLFADVPTSQQGGRTGLPNAGTSSDDGKTMKRWRKLAGLDDTDND